MNTFFWLHSNWAWCLRWIALCWISDTPTKTQVENCKAYECTEELNMLLKTRKAPLFYSSASDSFVSLDGIIIPPKTLIAWNGTKREFVFRPGQAC